MEQNKKSPQPSRAGASKRTLPLCDHSKKFKTQHILNSCIVFALLISCFVEKPKRKQAFPESKWKFLSKLKLRPEWEAWPFLRDVGTISSLGRCCSECPQEILWFLFMPIIYWSIQIYWSMLFEVLKWIIYHILAFLLFRSLQTLACLLKTKMKWTK